MGYGIKLRNGVFLTPESVSGLIVTDGPSAESRRTIQLLVGNTRTGAPAVVTLVEEYQGQAEQMAAALRLDYDAESYWEWNDADFDQRGVGPKFRAHEAEALRAALAAKKADS